MMDDYLTNANERGAWAHPVDEIEPAPESDMVMLADSLGRLIEFICRSGQPGTVGRRMLVVAYLLRPDLVGCRSLAALARGLGMTRAGADKICSEFRDTFGIRSNAMRDERTRERCRQAQANRRG